MARELKTDVNFKGKLRFWTMVQGVLFVVFTLLLFLMPSGFMTIYGVVYLLSLFLALGVTIRMRNTIETKSPVFKEVKEKRLV